MQQLDVGKRRFLAFELGKSGGVFDCALAVGPATQAIPSVLNSARSTIES